MKENIFPYDFFYEFHCDVNLVDQFLQHLQDEPIEWAKVFADKDNQNISTTEYGYPLPKNKELENWLSNCIVKVSDKYFKKEIVKISDIWLTRSTFGANSFFHIHSLSFFSGLLYLHDSNTPTEFVLPNKFYSTYSNLFGGVLNNKNKNTIFKVFPEKGKLIIWPSYIEHRIGLHKQTNTRYTIAFNTFIDGIVSAFPTQKLTVEVKKTQ